MKNNKFKFFTDPFGFTYDKISDSNLLKLYIDNLTTPIIIYCSNDEQWMKLLNDANINYTLIDTNTIKYDDLIGTCRKRDENLAKGWYYEPIWLKELNNTKVLVVNNFDNVPPKSIYPAGKEDYFYNQLDDNDLVIPGQYEYSFLWRNNDEDSQYKELNVGSPYKFPLDAVSILIIKVPSKNQLDQMILSRAFCFDLTK